MSTGSMVEDIERQHIPGSGDGTGDDGKGCTTTVVPGIPDLTQPPPNHPAYRGPSPQTQLQQSRKSPMNVYSGRPKSASYSGNVVISEKGPSSSGLPGPPLTAPQILSGNLLPTFSTSISSQPSNAQSISTVKKLSPDTIFGSRVVPIGDTETGARQKIDSSPALKSAPLLTPADLLQCSSSVTSSSSSTITTVTHLQDKVSVLLLLLYAFT